jgi:uncharacterized protein
VTTTDLPMFPLGMVVFPHQVVGLCVFEERYQVMLNDLTDDVFGTCLISRGCEVGGLDERTSVGTLVKILDSRQVSNGQTLLMVEGTGCVEVSNWLVDAPYPRATVRERGGDDEVDLALLNYAESAVRSLRALQSEVHTDVCLRRDCEMDGDPLVRSWQLCALTPMSVLDQFAMMSLANVNDRLRMLAEVCCERYGDYQRLLALDDSTRFRC